MKILIVAFNYPSERNSTDFVFVKMLVDEFARQGHECVVVAPHSVTHNRCVHYGEDTYEVNHNTIRVIRPNYLSLSSLTIGKYYVSNILHKFCVRRSLRNLKFKPDVVYCHFWKQGIEAYPFAKGYKLPLFVASGECEIFEDNRDGSLSAFCDYVKGVVCVSSKNKNESIELNLARPENCVVIPNSIDDSLFRQMIKYECRNKLNLSQTLFIVVFVGSFTNRKGTMRVAEAIKRTTMNDIYSFFIGAGTETPDCNNILYKNKVDHADLPLYLNAADIFVLPTLQEGCCNAIVEALACGLPVVSSNLSFNWDILNEKNSIMVDPEDINAISEAILKLKNDNSLRRTMSAAAFETAKSLLISERAKHIIEFMQSKISDVR